MTREKAAVPGREKTLSGKTPRRKTKILERILLPYH